MRRLLSFLIPTLIVVLLLLVVFGLGFAVVAGVALGTGWLLRRLFEFTFFEATLLGALFSALAIYLVTYIVRGFVAPDLLRLPDNNGDAGEDENREYKKIPSTRFYKSAADRTWEAWLRRELANDIYMEFQDAPHTLSNLSDSQTQELSIRLADIATSLLKRKTARTRNLTVDIGALRREMTRMRQRAYDDDILRLAVNAININLDYYEEIILDLIREGGWSDPATPPESEEDER